MYTTLNPIKIKPHNFFWLIAFLITGFFANAQQYLYLKKQGTVKIREVKKYTTLEVKTFANPEIWEKGLLTDFNNESLTVDDIIVYKFTDIKEIKILKTTQKAMGKGLKLGGLLYGGIVTINSLTSDVSPVVFRNNLIAAGCIYAFGWLIDLTSKRKFNLETDWKFEGIDFKDLD